MRAHVSLHFNSQLRERKRKLFFSVNLLVKNSIMLTYGSQKHNLRVFDYVREFLNQPITVFD